MTRTIGFDWGTLAKDSVVVDVGGGNGSQSMILARAFPHLYLVVQERKAVISAAEQFWTEEGMNKVIESGRVKLQGETVRSLAIAT